MPDLEYINSPDSSTIPIIPPGSSSEPFYPSTEYPYIPVVTIPSQTTTEAPEVGYVLDGIETYALSPVQSSTGLKGILLDVIGPYDNIITQYRYQANSDSRYTYVHETTPDYPWIASAALFIVLVYSCFSLLRRALWMK